MKRGKVSVSGEKSLVINSKEMPSKTDSWLDCALSAVATTSLAFCLQGFAPTVSCCYKNQRTLPRRQL